VECLLIDVCRHGKSEEARRIYATSLQMYAASRTNDDIIDHASVADASLIALHLSLVELDLFQWVEPVSKIVERDSCLI
jgi:hypothetical protein